jgi:hydroxymethylbilane synthase
VPTRIEKLDRGDYDALLLAAAGLHRLGLEGRIAEYLDPDIVMPAPGQGAIAVESRDGDARVIGITAAIDHGPTRLATMAERACLAQLEGGCQVPVGVLGSWRGHRLSLSATVTSLDGGVVIREHVGADVRSTDEAVRAGEHLAARLVRQGAAALLAAIRSAAHPDARNRESGE